MTFEQPAWLFVLLAVPVLWVAFSWARRRRDRKLAAFVHPGAWAILNPEVSRTARRWKAFLLFGAFAFAVIAAARPTWGTRERLVRETGIDIVLAVDVSRSMLATDVPPNRLESARGQLRQILAAFPGQRVAIVPFAGDAFVQCPLTTDYAIALQVLDGLGTRTVGAQGTNIARAIEVSREAFEEGGVGSRVLVLLTDGEHHEEGLEEQIAAARTEGLRIFTLGIGSPEGAPIKDDAGRLLEAPDGTKVLSRLDVETLRRIADETGGAAYVAGAGRGLDVRPLIDQLRGFERAEFSEEQRVVREERYQWPLAIALVLLFIEGIIGERRRAAAPRSQPQVASP